MEESTSTSEADRLSDVKMKAVDSIASSCMMHNK